MYQVLDRNLLPIGRLTLNPGNNATTFWADSIQKQIAQDNSQSDPASTMSMILNQGSSDANEKLFNHSLSVTFDNSDSVGAKVEAQSTYLMYQDEGNNRYYLMSVIQVDQESNYRTAQAQNTAIIELGKIFTTVKTFTQARLGDILKYVFSFAPFSVTYPDDNQVVLDSYVIDAKDSVLKVLQDLQVKYDIDMDAYVDLDINGRINNRIVSFENIGTNKGLILRYGSRNKGFENLVKTTVSDTLYTKYHITGVTKDGNTNAGSIKSVNDGKDYIVDDNANQKYNPIGASQNPPTYLEVYLENTVLSEPLALLSWGKQIMGLFNHPRDNYTVTAMHDTGVSLGDTVVIQDNSKKPAVVISARVIQMTSSFASPETNVIVLGEFTNLTSTKSDTGNTVLTQLKKDITTAQNSANEAINTAELAQQNADKANQAAQTASQKIDTTMANEKSRVDGLLDQQNTKIQSVVKEASDYTDSAKAEVLNRAQSLANDAESSAIAESNKVRDNLAQEIQDRTKAISDANTHADTIVNNAKTDLTNSIAKETADRTKAINDANTKAQGFADQAKTDAISAATTADGKINKRIDDTADSINSTISQNKLDADGKISTVSSTVNQALNELSTKVSQTDYDKKTGDLSTQINQTSDTATQSKQDIVDIKTKDNQQDSRMTTIESDANGTKTTVSNIQTKQGTQSADISTLQQRADGFESTVTKVNNLSVGGRNLLKGTKQLNLNYGGNTGTTVTKVDYDSSTKMWHVTAPKGSSTNAGVYFGESVIKRGVLWSLSFDIKGTGIYSGTSARIEGSTITSVPQGSVTDDWTRVSATGTATADNKSGVIYFDTTNSALDVYIKLLKIENGNLPSPYTEAPEDVDSSISKAQQTADQASLNLANYKTDADGRITKAQADIVTNANSINNKVDTTTYNQKTGQLTTDLNSVTQTADQSKQDIASIKQDNTGRDSKINSITSDVNGTKQDISAIKTANGNQDSKIASITSDVSGLNAKYTETNSKLDNLSVGGRNLYIVNQASPGYINGANGTIMGASSANQEVASDYISVLPNTTYIFQAWGNILKGQQYWAGIGQYDSNKEFINRNPGVYNATVATADTKDYKKAIFTTSSNAGYIRVSSRTFGNYQIKVEQGTLTTDWTPAPEDTDTKMATISAGLDGLSGQFTDYKTSNNGTITTMQGNISANTSAINTKVSLDTFNSTTGDLNTKYGQVNTKVDSVTTTVGDIKKKNDQQDSDIAQVKVTADSITNWVKDSNGNISSSMMTALFNTTALKDFDKNSSVKSQTANMISSAVSSSENGMRSLISQKADSTVIGTISDSLSDLQKSIQWEQIAYDDLNFLKGQGNYLITSGAGINSPIQPWFYITVDAPRGDRITQHIWKDLDASASYSRTFDGSNWSAWIQIANSSTLLSIFNDQWSLGTYINTSIGQKIASGISGLPDGTLALTGSSIHLTGDTIVDGSFMTKALSTQDATIGRKLTLGSGGSIDSKVLTMDDNSFNVLADNINSVYTSYDNWQVTTYGMFSINSSLGSVQSAGSTHIVDNASGRAVDGSYFTQYSTNQVYMTSTASDQDSDFLQQTQMTSTMLVLASGKGTSIQNRPNTTVVRSTGITTSGYISSGNLQLNGSHSIISADGNDINFTRPDGNEISIRAYWVTAGNIRLNGNHSIISQDGGKLYITNAYGNASDLSVKSLSQTSLVSTKEHIGNIDPEYALAETLKADVRQYNFIGDPTDDIHVTPMIDDVEGKMYIPKDWLSYEGDSVDTYTIIGYLVQSVKALQAEIDELKGK